MSFQENLAQMPSVDHLSGLNVLNAQNEVIHHIPAIEGKLGSLKLYHALAQKFANQLNAEAAAQGLAWFAEHVEDAKNNAGKHPNIDLLFRVQAEQLNYTLQSVER
ncbi:MAG: DUF2322 family protein [Neisseria sp.]|nr:DUF2322 family protein [Neisseria sp.]